MSRATHPIPATLEPVLALANTVHIATGVDDLAGGPASLSRFLKANRLLLDRTAVVSRFDYRLALDLRSGLRHLAALNNGGSPDNPTLAAFRVVLDRLPLTANLPPDPLLPHRLPPDPLQPHRLTPVRAALATIVAGYATAVATATWPRLRTCPATNCAWAFWDSSAKGTRRWCTMRICGNRAKARTFTQRHATRQPAPS